MPGKVTRGILSWSRRGEETGRITIISDWDERYIRLVYTLRDYRSGGKHEYDYKIFLTTIPSNLGKGEIL